MDTLVLEAFLITPPSIFEGLEQGASKKYSRHLKMPLNVDIERHSEKTPQKTFTSIL
jgi:hypothetical protein